MCVRVVDDVLAVTTISRHTANGKTRKVVVKSGVLGDGGGGWGWGGRVLY